MQRPSFEFQILVLRVLAFMLRRSEWSEQRAELDRALDDGIKDIEGRRDRREE